MMRVEDRLITEKPAIRTGLLQSSNYGQRLTEVVMATKKCGKCGKVKTAGEFYINRGGKLGRRSECIACPSALAKARGWKPADPINVAWRNMINRCYKKSTWSYYRYGGRGIRVCRRWRNSRANFIADMGKKPTAEHELDRIDNNGDYTPENCRGVTHKENSRNTSHCKLTDSKADSIRWQYDFGQVSSVELAKIFNVHQTTIQRVVKTDGTSWRNQ